MAADRRLSRSKIYLSPYVPRKRRSRAFWIKMLVEFSKSDLSVQGFCDLKKLSSSNFYAWRKRLQGEGNRKPVASSTFIPLEVMGNEQLAEPSKQQDTNLEEYASPAIKEASCGSGLSVLLNDEFRISIDKDFHGPTLQRLVQLFSSGDLSPC